MNSEEKIFEVIKKIKEKMDLSPDSVEIDYRASFESLADLSPEEEVMIINKLEDLGVIEVTYNAGSEYI